MTPSLLQRLLVLAAIALTAGVAALAIVEHRGAGAPGNALTSAPTPASWNAAFAGSRGPAGDAQRTTCGEVLGPDSLGVTHPVLPCGARIVLRRGDAQVLTEIIDHRLTDPGHQLEVTETLAEILGIEGSVELEWRFATETSG